MPQVPIAFPLFGRPAEPSRVPTLQLSTPSVLDDFGRVLAVIGNEIVDTENQKQRAEEELKASELFTEAVIGYEKARQGMIEEGSPIKDRPARTLEVLRQIRDTYGKEAGKIGPYGRQKFFSLFGTFSRERAVQSYREDTERFVSEKRAALDAAVAAYKDLAIGSATDEGYRAWLESIAREYDRGVQNGILSPKESLGQKLKLYDETRVERAKRKLQSNPMLDPTTLDVPEEKRDEIIDFVFTQRRRAHELEEQKRKEEERIRKELRENTRTQILIDAMRDRAVPSTFYDPDVVTFLGADEHNKLRTEIEGLLKVPDTFRSDVDVLSRLEQELARMRSTRDARNFIAKLPEFVRAQKLTKEDMFSLSGRAVSISQEILRKGEVQGDERRKRFETEAEAYLRGSLTVSGPLATTAPEKLVQSEAIRAYWETMRRDPGSDPFAVANEILLNAAPTLATQFGPQMVQLRQLGYRSAEDVLAAVREGKIDQSTANMYINLIRLRDRLDAGVGTEPRPRASSVAPPRTSNTPRASETRERERTTGEVMAERAGQRPSARRPGLDVFSREFLFGPDAVIREEVERRLKEKQKR